MSYTLSTVTIPSLLAFPSASSASLVFTNLTTRALTDLRILAGISTSSFLLAYVFSPRGARHPYLLWTSLLVVTSGFTDLVLRPERAKTITDAKQARTKDRKMKGRMDSSYEVVGDSHSEGNGSTSDEGEEEVNGEEIRSAMEAFKFSQSARAGISALGFAVSVVGLWGDGA